MTTASATDLQTIRKELYNKYRSQGFETEEALQLVEITIKSAQRQVSEESPDMQPTATAPKPSTVRSVPMRDTVGSQFRWDRLPTFFFGFCIFGLWWAIGGKYTIEGLPLAANVVISWFKVKPVFQPITDPRWYVFLCWLPFVVSYIERHNRPRRGLAFYGILSIAFAVWLVVSGLDMGSTYMAITNPDPSAILLAHQVAKSGPLSIGWSIATTFAPEICIAALWAYLWNGTPLIVKVARFFKRS